MNPKIIISILILATLLILFANYHKKENKKTFRLENKEISFLIADTLESRAQGLSKIDSLPENSVMLFVFDKPDIYKIWMKNMKFPIDIIWLNENKKITHIEENISPETFPTTFFPPEKSLYIIEANVGFVVKNALLVGKVLDWTLK